MENIKNLASIKDPANFFFVESSYIDYKIDLDVLVQTSFKVLEENEMDLEDGENTMVTIHESQDFIRLKHIVASYFNIYAYCPYCKKDMYIKSLSVSDSTELDEHEIIPLSHYFTNEEYDHIVQSAKEYMNTRYDEFIEKYTQPGGIAIRHFTCTSPKNHNINVVFKITADKRLVKIGQYPSIVEFEPKLKTYEKVLSTKDYREMKKAIGLKSHNNGIGAYTYLRRVFEKLIYKRIQEILKENGQEFGMPLPEIMNKRMNEKIDLLGKKHLPAFMVDNKILYSIISKGIHELTEKECLQHFETLKISVFLILEQEKHNREQRILLKETSTNLSNIHASISTETDK